MLVVQLRCQESPLCVVVDDSLLVTMASASVKASVQVIAMFPGRAVGQEYVDEVTSTMGRNVGGVKVMNKKATSLTKEDLGGRKIDVLMAEPYYTSCSRMLPWRNLRFWYSFFFQPSSCYRILMLQKSVTLLVFVNVIFYVTYRAFS